ncbi:uncharacterized protein BJ212DRAFT_1296412 [Suillus subaureus]|uniref:Uncharacterized protein n=1 Tax=Suillus subaureus TaxID=48587 RepID=A0A9P7JI85_9AGAM|nr:uncharacterized protein BJ212DRAFT_1296412 [Suillus subaureus]KAG1823890.1 hypothetical protein BJ212DRAFT_1296412 [Suillus subaureus]
MSRSNLKCTQAPGSSSDDEPNPKHVRSERSWVAPSPLVDEGAWHILFQYLTTEMTYPQMEEEFLSDLGDRYCADDWKDARDTLFSADNLNDVATPLANLQALYAKHITPQSSSPSNVANPPEDSPLVATPARTPGCLSAYTCKSHHRPHQQPRNPYINLEAEEDSTDDDDDEEEEAEGNHSAWSPLVTSLPESSAKQTFLSAIDNIFDKDLQQPLSPNTFGTKDSPLPSWPGSQASYEECEAVKHACPKLPNPGWTVSDILHDGEVIGCLYKGEQYYMGLLLKRFRQDGLEIVVTPHPNYIRLHLQSGWNTCFIKATELAFSMQFLCISDEARVITGEVCLEIGKVVSTNHAFGKLTKEEVEVSKYYLDRCPLMHALQSQLPTQQICEPPPDTESLEIGDYVKVLEGYYKGKCGTISWFSLGTSVLYLWVDNTPMCASALVMIKVPLAWVQQMYLALTIKYTKDKGYDVRPGDFVKVVHGPEHQMTGVVHSIDFPMAHLTLLSQTDESLINIPIRFMVKMRNASLDTFKNIIGKEVFIIGVLKHPDVATIDLIAHWLSYGMWLNGAILERHNLIAFCEIQQKSYLKPPPQSVTPPPEKIIASSSSIACPNMQSSSILSTWTTNPQDIAGAVNHLLAINSTTSSELTSDPWTVNPEDTETGQENIQDNSPLPWLMRKEFSLTFLMHHAVLKVLPNFMGGKLHK